MMIKLDKIVWEDKFYPRNGVDWKTAYVYAESMRAGAEFPPIDVVRRENNYLGLDGRHRCRAIEQNGGTEIAARVVQVPEKEMFLYAVRCNLRHGRQLSTHERLQIAQRLKEDWGFPITRVAAVLNIPKRSLLRLLSRRLAPRGSVGGVWEPPADVVLKAPFEHLAGRPLSVIAENAQRPAAAGSQVELLAQVQAILRADTFDLNDADVREALLEIGAWVAKNRSRIAVKKAS